MEIPAYYYKDARYVPNSINHIVTLTFQVIPKKEIDNVQTTYLDGRVEDNCFEDFCEHQTDKNLILTLNKVEGRAGLKSVHEIVMNGVKNAMIEFSKSGKHLAIFIKEQNLLSVYDSRDILKCFEKVEQKKPLFSIKIE